MPQMEKFCNRGVQCKLVQGDITFWCGSTLYNDTWWSWVVSGWAALHEYTLVLQCQLLQADSSFSWSHIYKPWGCQIPTLLWLQVRCRHQNCKHLKLDNANSSADAVKLEDKWSQVNVQQGSFLPFFKNFLRNILILSLQ